MKVVPFSNRPILKWGGENESPASRFLHSRIAGRHRAARMFLLLLDLFRRMVGIVIVCIILGFGLCSGLWTFLVQDGSCASVEVEMA